MSGGGKAPSNPKPLLTSTHAESCLAQNSRVRKRFLTDNPRYSGPNRDEHTFRDVQYRMFLAPPDERLLEVIACEHSIMSGHLNDCCPVN